MRTTSLIHRYIGSLPAGKPFATKELLPYGLRSTIDSHLSRLVKRGHLVRLSRGIFIACNRLTKENFPAAIDVALVKAKAFGKQLFMHTTDIAQQLDFMNKKSTYPTFATFHKTSSFAFLNTRIQFQHIAPSNSPDALSEQIIRSIKFIVKETREKQNANDLLKKVMNKLGRVERFDFWLAAQNMPGWMSDQLFQLTRYQTNQGAKVMWEFKARQKLAMQQNI